MLCSREYQIMRYVSPMQCQNIVPQNKMKSVKEVKKSMILYILYFVLLIA